MPSAGKKGYAMKARVAMGIFALTAMLAGNALAADEVVVSSGSEHESFAAGKHEFSGTITSADVPMKMGMVVYDENDKALAVFSFQNSGLETKIENVASIEVVDQFPSRAEVEAMLKNSEWSFTLYHADGVTVRLRDTAVFKDNEFTLVGAPGPGPEVSGVGHRGGEEGTPVGAGCTIHNGNEVIFEWITPTVMRSDEWDKGKRAGKTKNNPAQWLGVFQLEQ